MSLPSWLGDCRQDLAASARPVELIATGGEGALLEPVQQIKVVDRFEHAMREGRMVGKQHDTVVVTQRNTGEGADSVKNRFFEKAKKETKV